MTELTTGWEADLPVADSLLRQFVHSYADRTAEMAGAVGGRTHRDAGRGLAHMGHPPLMVLPSHVTGNVVPEGLVIQRVRTETDLAAFRRVLVDGFGLPGGEPSAIADPRLLDEGLLHLFIGSVDGAPVATAGSAVHHGLVEVDWVATLPEARGKGYGTALTWRAVDVAPDLPAVLIASDDGQPVYEKMGFLRLMRVTMYFRGTG